MADGWEVIQKSTAEEATKLAAFGRLCTRLTLHVLKKEKHGREPAGHESINAICTLFAADLAGGAKPSVRKEEAKPTVELEVKNVLASTPAELALLQKSAHEAGPIVTWHNELFFFLRIGFLLTSVCLPKHFCKVHMFKGAWKQDLDFLGQQCKQSEILSPASVWPS